jgi:hypothetical protein
MRPIASLPHPWPSLSYALDTPGSVVHGSSMVHGVSDDTTLFVEAVGKEIARRVCASPANTDADWDWRCVLAGCLCCLG